MRIIDRDRKAEYSEADGSRLINEWKQQKTDVEQSQLWLKWTGLKLSEETSWVKSLQVDESGFAESQEERKIRLLKNAE